MGNPKRNPARIVAPCPADGRHPISPCCSGLSLHRLSCRFCRPCCHTPYLCYFYTLTITSRKVGNRIHGGGSRRKHFLLRNLPWTELLLASGHRARVFVRRYTSCSWLFGGDPSWGIGTYMPVSEYYRNSVSYRATVATTEGTYQRAPASCWYAMGNAVVNKMLTAPSAVTVYLTWTISSGLWNTVRVPSQCFSFCDNGVLLHGALSTETTQTLAVVVLPGNTWLTMEVGDTVYYMLRQRAPRFIIPGPFEVSADGRSLQLQGNPNEAGFVAPAPSAHLLYLGRRGDHPAQLCVMENDPDRARASIFSVDSVSFVATTSQDPVYALQSYLIRDGTQQLWTQLTHGWPSEGLR